MRHPLLRALVLAVLATAAQAAGDPVQRLAEQFMDDYDAQIAVPVAAAVPESLANLKPDALMALTSVRDVLGLPKGDMPAEDAAALDRLIQTFPALAGTSGRFDHADLDPIVAALADDLAQEVGQEIIRQASVRIQPGTFGESLRRRAVEAHLAQHGEAYMTHGRAEADRRVREGLREFLHKTGTASAAPEPLGGRRLALADLKQFAIDARVLERVSRRSRDKGLPAFTFPNGMSVDDLKAIKATEVPPNGKLASR